MRSELRIPVEKRQEQLRNTITAVPLFHLNEVAVYQLIENIRRQAGKVAQAATFALVIVRF
jgi:hypothetical protein